METPYAPHPNRALFLDVDGVLVHHDSIGGARASGERGSFYYAAMVDPACAARLVRVLAQTDAQVVVSSTWRQVPEQVSGLRRALLAAGLSKAQCRTFAYTEQRNDVREDAVRRHVECRAWLLGAPHVTRILCLDDGWVSPDWAFDPLPNYFTGGLLDAHVEPAIAWLLDPQVNRDGRAPVARRMA